MTQKQRKIKNGLLIAGAFLAAGVGAYFIVRAIRKSQDDTDETIAAQLPATGTAPVTSTVPGTQPQTFTKDTQLDPTPSGVGTPAQLQGDVQLQAAFDAIKKRFGKPIAQNVERIYRLETGNFKSGNYLSTGSAGMVAAGAAPNYGWNSLQTFWNANPDFKPLGTVRWYVLRENQTIPYLAFKGAGGAFTVAEIMRLRGNDPGKWISLTDTAAQNNYRNKVNTMTLKYTL
jgi:hypothetical protein